MVKSPFLVKTCRNALFWLVKYGQIIHVWFKKKTSVLVGEIGSNHPCLLHLCCFNPNFSRFSRALPAFFKASVMASTAPQN